MTRSIALVVTLVLSYWCSMAAAATPNAFYVQAGRFKETSDRLSLANLLGGLFLTDDQLGRLIPLAVEADELRDSHLEKATATLQGARERYESLVSESIKTPQAMGTAVQRAAVDSEHEIKELKKTYNTEFKAIQDRACDILTPSQKRVITTFAPCVVPPRTLTDPVRVGQAANHEKAVAFVDLLRRAPDDIYQASVDRVVDLALEHMQHKKGVLHKGAHSALKKDLLEQLERLRRMDDTDFALSGADAVAALAPFDEYGEASDMSRWRPNKAGQFLLCHKAPNVLKRWRRARLSTPLAACASANT